MRTWIPKGATAASTVLLGILLAGMALTLGACYPETVDNTAELDLVLTNFDASFDFASVHTYSMPDSIVDIAKLIDEDSDGSINLTDSQQRQITGWIAAEMAALGYERVLYDESSDTPPDFFVMPGAITATNVVVGGGWGCYPYYYWSGCGWGYPYCCSYSYTYDSGTLLVGFFQPESAEPDANFVVRWTGALNGVLSSTTTNNMTRISTAIGQMFAQSPYLGTAPSMVTYPSNDLATAAHGDASLSMAKRGIR